MVTRVNANATATSSHTGRWGQWPRHYGDDPWTATDRRKWTTDVTPTNDLKGSMKSSSRKANGQAVRPASRLKSLDSRMPCTPETREHGGRLLSRLTSETRNRAGGCSGDAAGNYPTGSECAWR